MLLCCDVLLQCCSVVMFCCDAYLQGGVLPACTELPTSLRLESGAVQNEVCIMHMGDIPGLWYSISL